MFLNSLVAIGLQTNQSKEDMETIEDCDFYLRHPWGGAQRTVRQSTGRLRRHVHTCSSGTRDTGTHVAGTHVTRTRVLAHVSLGHTYYWATCFWATCYKDTCY